MGRIASELPHKECNEGSSWTGTLTQIEGNRRNGGYLSWASSCPAYLETGSQHGGGRCGTAIFQHRIPSARFGSIDSGSLHVAYVRHEVILEKFVVNYIAHVTQQQDRICHLQIRKHCLVSGMCSFVSGLIFLLHALFFSIDPILGVTEKKGNCAACHPSRPAADGTPPLFTDFSYDNLGVGRNPHNRFYQQSAQLNPDGRAFIDRGLGAFTKLASEDGKFKVPTLRNVARTSPYFHNGYFQTLRGVVDFYNTRDVKPACKNPFTDEASALIQNCWPVPESGENVNTEELGDLKLNDQEVDDIVAFMHTLTDGWKLQSRER